LLGLDGTAEQLSDTPVSKDPERKCRPRRNDPKERTDVIAEAHDDRHGEISSRDSKQIPLRLVCELPRVK
jgi:hypothetical protein